MNLVIGIDAGGTETVTRLADQSGALVREVRGPGANLQAEGEAGVERVLADGVARASEGAPFAAIADKLEGVLSKFGVSRFGEPGEAFDPVHHEALMHVQAELAEGTTTTTVVQVLQPGYRIGERVIRAARVAVADPE